MLCLARNVEEKLYIEFAGVTITVQVLRIKGKSVQLGIDAPREVAIHRHDAHVKHRGKFVEGDDAKA